MKEFKFIDFFAGVGGFRKGLENVGAKCVGFCEFDKFAVASYTSLHLITDEQREYLATLDKKKRVKEILKEEYRNGEWHANDVRTIDVNSMPKADCWCFGFPCQDISVAGKQAGLDGERSGLFYAVTDLIRQQKEEDRPKYLFIENVKNLLSINGGWDFLKVLVELDEIGYNAGWQVINSSAFVPQNRERIFIIGCSRAKCGSEIFPVGDHHEQNSISINQVGGMVSSTRDNPQPNRVYDPKGLSPTLNSTQGGCREPRVVLPVLTPDRVEKRQNGRRFKNNGDDSFTLTQQDRHGVAIGVSKDE